MRCLDGAVHIKTLVLPEKQGPNEDQRAAAKLLRSRPPMFMRIMWQELIKHQDMPSASPVDLATPPSLLGPSISPDLLELGYVYSTRFSEGKILAPILHSQL